MSARRSSNNMMPSRTRHSVETQQLPRHIPRTRPEATSTYISQIPAMSQPSYDLVSGAPGYCVEAAPCWQTITDSFYPGNDSAYIPTSSVAPMALTHPSYWEVMPNYDIDSASTSSSSSGSSSSTKACISPPMSEAEILPSELYQTSPAHLDMDHFPYTDPWVSSTMMPPTPPTDPMFDNLDLFNTGKNEHMSFMGLPDAALPECEYLGVSKLQFSRSSLP